MDEAIGDRPSVTPPVLIASSSQDVAVVEPPTAVTPEGDTSRTSTPKRRRVDVLDALRHLQEKKAQYDLELRQMEAKAVEREETRAREAAEREEQRHREAVEREERFFREMREREERRGEIERLLLGRSASWQSWRNCSTNNNLKKNSS